MRKKIKGKIYKSGTPLALAQEQAVSSAFVVLNEQLQARVDILEIIATNAMNFTDGLFDPPYARDAGGIKFLRWKLIESYKLLETPKNQDPIFSARRR